jgi:hypothetical protein
LLDYVGEGKYTTCGEVAGISRQLDYPGPCVVAVPEKFHRESVMG